MREVDTEEDLQRRIQAARGVVPPPQAKRGDCDLCGEWSGQLDQGVCPPCRDERRVEK